MIILDSKGENFAAGDTENSSNSTRLILDDGSGAFGITAKTGNSSINIENGQLRIGDDGSGQNTFLIIDDGEQKTTINADIELNLTSAENILLGIAIGARMVINNQDSRISFQADEVNVGDLPTSNPNKGGQIWNDSGTMKISAG